MWRPLFLNGLGGGASRSWPELPVTPVDEVPDGVARQIGWRNGGAAQPDILVTFTEPPSPVVPRFGDDTDGRNRNRGVAREAIAGKTTLLAVRNPPAALHPSQGEPHHADRRTVIFDETNRRDERTYGAERRQQRATTSPGARATRRARCTRKRGNRAAGANRPATRPPAAPAGERGRRDGWRPGAGDRSASRRADGISRAPGIGSGRWP